MDPSGVVLENHSLVISGDRIVDIQPIEKARGQYNARHTKRLTNHVIMPGMINAHGHSAMSLLRGFADDLPLMTWLTGHIWPAEQSLVDDSFVADGTLLACAEMLRSGTTCVNDMYFFPDAAARIYSEVGMRATVGLVVMSVPTAWAATTEEYFAKGLALVDEFKDHPLVQVAFAPHAPYTVDDKTFTHIAALSEELSLPIHIHVHETAQEVVDSMKEYGCRPLKRLERLGILGPSTMAVHLTQVNDEDMELLARNRVHAVHCPESNMKLASGAAPVQAMLDAGIDVALGTDGPASNNDLDMFGEMRTAAMLGKLTAGRADAVSAWDALRMATLGGAEALGLAHELGSLTPGKLADVVAVDMSDPGSMPMFHPASQLVYSTQPAQVTDVWVGGRLLLNNKELTSVDMDKVRRKTEHWRRQLNALSRQQQAGTST